MKKSLLVVVMAITVNAWAPVQAQGTFSSEGEIVDGLKALAATYVEGDWDAYRSFFADTVSFYPSTVEAVSMDERIEAHMVAHDLFDEIEFIDTGYGVIENDGETWGVMWGTWSGKNAATGEVIRIPMHIGIRYIDGKGVAEYGYWDTAPLQAAIDAAGER